MARNLFFFPAGQGDKSKGIDVAKLFNDAGIGSLLRDGDSMPRPVQLDGPGPSGKTGIVVAWYDDGQGLKGNNPRLGYHPNQQTWWPAKANKAAGLPAGRVWYGYENARPPVPDDFLRKPDVLIDGYLLELGKPAQPECSAPTARSWLLPNVLKVPHRCGINDDGEPVLVPKSAWQHLCERGAWAFEQCEKQMSGAGLIPWREAFEYCVEVLSINYRVNLEIVDWLELIDKSDLLTVMAHTVDLDTILEIQADLKKNSDASSPNT